MSRGRRLLLAALLACAPVSVMAEAPARVMRPPVNPKLEPLPVVPTPAPVAPLAFDGHRPKPRPAVPGAAPGEILPPVASDTLAFAETRPRARPERRASIAAGIAPSGASIAAFAPAPPPEERPSAGATIPFAAMPRPEVRPEVVEPVALPPSRSVAKGPGGSVCGVASIRGEPIPDKIEKTKGCGLKDGVRVTAVAGLRLSLPIETDCNTARTFDRWVEQAVKPAVGRTGGGLARVEIAGSYTCRSRNNQPGAAVSEHGRGRAVDVSGLTLMNGSTITVAQGWRNAVQGPILKRIAKAACGPFGTVLGPGSDGFHEDHLHLDTAPRKTSAYCR